MGLFQSTVVEKYINTQNQKVLKEKWEAYKVHFHDPNIQENIRNAKEEQYQEGFLRDLFVKLKKHRIASIGVKSDWKDGLRTALYETRLVCPEQGRRARTSMGCNPSINGGATH
jgi:hypothetical protein